MAASSTTIDMSVEDGVDLEFFDEVMGVEDLEAMKMRQEVMAKKQTDQLKKIQAFNKAWNINSRPMGPPSGIDPLPSTSYELQVAKQGNPEKLAVVVNQTPDAVDPRLMTIKTESRKQPNPCAIANPKEEATGYNTVSPLSEQDLFVVKSELCSESEHNSFVVHSSEEDDDKYLERRSISDQRTLRRQRSRSPRYSRSPRRSRSRRRSRSYSRSPSRSRSRTPERYRRKRQSHDSNPLTVLSKSMQDQTMLQAMLPMMTMMMPMMAKLAASTGPSPVSEPTAPIETVPQPSVSSFDPDVHKRNTSRKPVVDITAQFFLEHKIDVSEFLAVDRQESDIRYHHNPMVSRKIQEAIDILDRQDTKLKSGKFLYVAPTYYKANKKLETRSPVSFNGLNVLFATTTAAKDLSPYDPFIHLSPYLRRMALMFGLDEGLIAKNLASKTAKNTVQEDVSNVRTVSRSTGKKCIIDRSTQTQQTKCADCARRHNKPLITMGTQTDVKTNVTIASTQTDLSGIVSYISLQDLMPSQIKSIKYLVKYLRQHKTPGSLPDIVRHMDNEPSETQDQVFQDTLQSASEAAEQLVRNANRYVGSFRPHQTFSRNGDNGNSQQRRYQGQWEDYEDCNNFMPADFNDQPPPKKKKRSKKRTTWMN